MRFLLSIASLSLAVSAVVVNGNESTGPRGQGNCALREGTFECSNGARCNYDDAANAFQCEGGTDEEEDSLESQGPPGKSCHSHGSHWDCDDGSFCEFENNVWTCQGEGGETSETGGPNCIMHGNHFHCSGGSGEASAEQCENLDTGEYDKGLHIGAIFILLASSFFGVGLPVALAGWKDMSIFKWALFIVKHFGTGVILCTALIHLLFHAFVMFDNECLGELPYEPTAAAISLAGVYIIFLIDYLGMRYNSRKTRELAIAAGTLDNKQDIPENYSVHTTPEAAMKQLKWEVNLLECGIVFHSVMIGVSLGATGGSNFVPFLIAIVFHQDTTLSILRHYQLFEGLGLGSRICLLKFNKWNKVKKSLMIFWFSIITSIGIAIGIGVHNSYSPNSKSALLAIGILNAISAGILIYASLVEMIAADWFKDPEMRDSGFYKTTLGISMLLLGSLLMAVLGKWA
ncbi:Zinc/iron permease [Wallemia mellicola]|uniref:Zinc/iron permease n=1 Tax=Wallemia mellicola TaxID=1708541 RepID=A0AB74KG64_9BASI|nr:hypothetical protein E3Q24_01396 [Wallemia mellicola]TIB87084.1 Zinc/iron permease [Wallemia mellicola]TIB90121.1 Zinc/iron permease [Wallemia mellicola]TIC42042.1 Zinc/iron permease [Wallemia mellicola]TIC50588.1 Zinc/iron permease [Wallemia mellicola]